jgi:hypothetical protein
VAHILVECDHPVVPAPGTEEWASQLLNALGRLASRVAHDINNPLAGIRNSFLLVKDGIPDSHPHRAFIPAIEREIARLAAFSRALHESFDVRTARSRLSLRAAVTEAVMALRQVVPPIGLDVDLGPAGQETPAMPGAAVRLLIRNAIQEVLDSSSPNASIGIRAERIADRVELSIQGWPNPEGVSAAESAERRLGSSRPTPGLVLFAAFAELLGGRVEADPTESGRDSVRLVLPLGPAGGPTDSLRSRDAVRAG